MRTDERVEGTWECDAASPEEARAKFGNPRVADDVEQIDYQAYELTVESVEAIG